MKLVDDFTNAEDKSKDEKERSAFLHFREEIN